MTRCYQQTHENLLNCARQQFLKLGFEKAGIRDICKAAHVTNGAFYRHFSDKEALFGALVDPVIKKMRRLYSVSTSHHFEIAQPENVKELWTLSESTIVEIITYIYDHFETFKLLLICSHGTRYASFLDDVVQLEVRQTRRLIKELTTQGLRVKTLEDEQWHMLIHAYYTSLAEIVLHSYPKVKALQYTRTLAEFFTAGWYRILGFD